MSFSKKKYLDHISKNITPHELKFMEGYVQMDEFSIRQVKNVFETNIVPSKNYFDFCFYIEENFTDWEDGNSFGYDYLFFYMASLFLYCLSEIDEGYSPDVASLYIRRVIQILMKHSDIEGAKYFYEFLSSISAPNTHVEYFLNLGKIFIIRNFLIKIEGVGAIVDEILVLVESFGDSSFSFITDSVECPGEWQTLNQVVAIPEELKNIDFDRILLQND